MDPNKKLEKVVKNLSLDLQNVREEKDSQSSSSSNGSKHKKKHKNKKKHDIHVENLNEHNVTFNVNQDGQVKSGEGTIKHSDINDREDLDHNNLLNVGMSFRND